MSFKNTVEKHLMHSKSDNMEIMFHNKKDRVIGELFKSLFPGYQVILETLMKGSNFVLLVFYSTNIIK